MRLPLLSLALVPALLATTAAAQKTYGTDVGGQVYEVDFGAGTATPLFGTGQSLLLGLSQTPDPNLLYAAGFTSGLFELNIQNQTLTPIGTTTPNMANVALNEDNGLYYGSNQQSLCLVDPVTPSVTPIGAYGLFGMYGLEYHPGLGAFLIANTFSSTLYSIDPATGTPTPIGSYVANQVSGIWYDELTGRTFGVTDTNGNGTMLEFDVTTGQATVIAVTGINFVGLGGTVEEIVGTAYCSGDGAGTACPCGNFGTTGTGCANSSGVGAIAEGGGSASVVIDALAIEGSQLLPGKPALLFAGSMQDSGGNGSLFGDGLRCVTGPIQRFDVKFPDAGGLATWNSNLISSQGWSAGDTRDFQIWYRDPSGSPCGGEFNLSNGLEVVLTP